VLLLAALAVLSSSACSGDDDATTSASSSTSSASSSALEGTTWLLATVALPTGVTADAVQTAALSFAAGGKLTGTTGCNNLAGTYATTARSLHIELGPMTLKACSDAAATAQERAVLAGLPATKRYAASDSSLLLQDEKGATLLAYVAGKADLAGTSWRVGAVNNGRGAMVTSSLTARLTAEFGADGTFTGFGGCNTLSGPYATSGSDGVAIGPLMSTKKSCGADVDQLELEYSTALANVARWEISGDVLTLRDASGAGQVTASAAKRG